ncbi:MAG: RNA methyltransferase [Saprospiraceae bacterium]
MISEKNTKIIRSLAHKKYRYQHNLFIAEGRKIIIDMLKSGFKAIHQLYLTEEAKLDNGPVLEPVKDTLILLTVKEMNHISNLDSASDMILIGKIPTPTDSNDIDFSHGIHLFLDQIQDPGNLGTIFRTAEWFGVKSIGMSNGCADYLQPKVIQSSMGSFWRLPIWIGDLKNTWPIGFEIFGADLQGNSLYETKFHSNGVLVIGSEGQGLSKESRTIVNHYVRIPAFSGNVESLNAANAAAIILSEWKRQTITEF